jgi:putative membrane protein
MIAATALIVGACDPPDATTASSEPVEGAAGVGAAAEDAAGGAVGLASANLPKTAPEFVRAAAIANNYELEAARLALQKAEAPATRQFAQRMIDHHTKLGQDLRAAAQAAAVGVDAPAGLDPRREEMMSNLRGVSQQDFDERYLEQQELAHQETLALMRGYAEGGDVPQLRTVAADAAGLVDQHLARAREVENALDDTGGAQAGLSDTDRSGAPAVSGVDAADRVAMAGERG